MCIQPLNFNRNETFPNRFWNKPVHRKHIEPCHNLKMSKISRREVLVALGAVGMTGCLPVRENPGASLAAAGVKVAVLGDFPNVGSSKNLDLSGNPAILVRLAKPQSQGVSVGDIHLLARSTVCTHVGCIVGAPVNNQVGCACHGSVFDLETGAVKQGPAGAPLPAFKLQIRDDGIYAVP